LALWRGPALGDFAYEAWAQPHIAQLEEQRLAALEERVEADLEAGAHTELTGELEALVEEFPMRERLRGQYMLTLYRSGRQAEALPPLLRERGLPHQLLVTTSYDMALEAALLEAGDEFDVVSYVAAGQNRGKFCHIRPDGSGQLINLPNTYATELSLDNRTVVL